MQLFLLSKDPRDCAYRLPLCYIWPMTKELGQLISSVLHKNYPDKLSEFQKSIISKYIPQGPELREFILRYPKWIYLYYYYLQNRLINECGWGYDKAGLVKAINVISMYKMCINVPECIDDVIPEILEYGYFRYDKAFPIPFKMYKLKFGENAFCICVREARKFNTSIKLPIDECLFLYTMYIDWKMSNK